MWFCFTLVTYRNNFYSMDPRQSDALIKSPISLEQELLRCETLVLIDSATTQSAWVRYLWTKMVLLENVFKVPKTLFIMLLKNEICNNFLQQYILLVEKTVLVSDSMFRCISKALNYYFGLPTMSWMRLFDLMIFLCELVTNFFPCVSQLRRVSCVLVDSSRVQLFWQSSLVTSELRLTTFCVTPCYRIVGDLTPILVHNFIFNSMDLPCESHRVISEHKW